MRETLPSVCNFLLVKDGAGQRVVNKMHSVRNHFHISMQKWNCRLDVRIAVSEPCEQGFCIQGLPREPSKLEWKAHMQLWGILIKYVSWKIISQQMIYQCAPRFPELNTNADDSEICRSIDQISFDAYDFCLRQRYQN